MGVAVAALAMLTLLPALLLIAGRRAFWPFVPRLGSEDDDPARFLAASRGVDRAAAPAGLDRDARSRSRRWRSASLTLDDDLTTANAFRGDGRVGARGSG